MNGNDRSAGRHGNGLAGLWVTLWVLLGLGIGCSGCSGPSAEPSEVAGIRMGGSSTLYPLSALVVREFATHHPGVFIDSRLTGTGAGLRCLCAGQIDLANASRPINAGELQACREQGIEFVELPVGFDAVCVVVNAANTWADAMTVEQLCRLWSPQAEGRVMRWNQIRSDWPDAPIHLYGPGSDSGTYDYFTKAIVGSEGVSRQDFAASEDDDVLVEAVAGDKYALAFFGLPYYLHHPDQLRAVAVGGDRGGDGQRRGPYLPTVDNVLHGTYQPLSRPLLIYVSLAASQRPDVRAFVEFYLSHAERLAKETGCIPLPTAFYAKALERCREERVGTAFGGGGARISVTMQYLYGLSLDDTVGTESR